MASGDGAAAMDRTRIGGTSGSGDRSAMMPRGASATAWRWPWPHHLTAWFAKVRYRPERHYMRGRRAARG
jgi:hypothetical protein